MHTSTYPFFIGCVLVLGCESNEETEEKSIEQEQSPEDSDDPEEEETDTAEQTQPPEDSSGTDGSSEDEADICTLKDQTSVALQLPATRDEAAQVTLVPGEGESYVFSKQAGAEGWFVLDVPSWMCDVQFYTEEGVSIELEYTPDWDLGDVATPVAECDDGDLYRHSWTFHAWGSYIVHVEAQQDSEFWLASVLVQ